MPCRTARELLELVRDFHHRLGQSYAELATRAERTKVKALLDYMKRHEEGLEAQLERYGEESAGALLDTWFARVPEIAECACFEGPELTRDMAIEDVVRTAFCFDDCLIEFVREMSELAPNEELRGLFSSLAELEQHEQRKVARAALEVTQGM
jgi:rubrerythrin